MCIAILNKPEGGIISEDILRKCWTYNSDGAGFAYPDNGKVTIVKELHRFGRFYNAYRKARKRNPNLNFLLHFRIKTHGLVSTANCHPFLVHEHLAFAHNGMIDGLTDKTKSDTVLFMEKVLRNMPKDFIEHEGIRRLIRKSTGWSKFVFIDAENKYRIINEEGGVWDGGNWYSNTTYQSHVTYRDYGGTVQVSGNTYPAATTYWQGKQYGSRSAVDTFTEEGLPAETKGAKSWPELTYTNDDIEDALPVKGETKEKRQCSECYSFLHGRMENHYGVCTKCLKEYEIIPTKEEEKK